MFTFALPAISALFVWSPIRPPVADPCALLTRAEATGLLGQPAAVGEAAGPQKDDDTGAKVSFCAYKGSTAVLIVSISEFSSAAAAKQTMTVEFLKSQIDQEGANVAEEPGIGDRSFYAYSDEGSMYYFQKGSKIIGVGASGPGAPKAAAVKSQLKAKSLVIASKM